MGGGGNDERVNRPTSGLLKQPPPPRFSHPKILYMVDINVHLTSFRQQTHHARDLLPPKREKGRNKRVIRWEDGGERVTGEGRHVAQSRDHTEAKKRIREGGGGGREGKVGRGEIKLS